VFPRIFKLAAVPGLAAVSGVMMPINSPMLKLLKRICPMAQPLKQLFANDEFKVSAVVVYGKSTMSRMSSLALSNANADICESAMSIDTCFAFMPASAEIPM